MNDKDGLSCLWEWGTELIHPWPLQLHYSRRVQVVGSEPHYCKLSQTLIPSGVRESRGKGKGAGGAEQSWARLLSQDVPAMTLGSKAVIHKAGWEVRITDWP